jgi:hypothetical protein
MPQLSQNKDLVSSTKRKMISITCAILTFNLAQCAVSIFEGIWESLHELIGAHGGFAQGGYCERLNVESNRCPDLPTNLHQKLLMTNSYYAQFAQ